MMDDVIKALVDLRGELEKAVEDEQGHIRSISGPRGRASAAVTSAHARNDIRQEVIERLNEIIGRAA